MFRFNRPFRFRPRRAKHRSIPSQSVRSTLPRRLLDRKPMLVAARPRSVVRSRQQIDLRSVKQRVLNLIPMYGLYRKLQVEYVRPSQNAMEIFKDPVGHVLRAPVRHVHCVKRKLRKNVLFALGIAGQGKRLSPGQGGTYRRTEDSNLSC